MNEQQLLLSAAFVLIVGLDLFSTAGIAGLLNINHTSLLSRQVGAEDRYKRLLQLSEPPIIQRANASTRLASGILRFFIAGLALLILGNWLVEANPGWIVVLKIAGVLLAAGLALAWLEWFVSQRAVRSPETWALRCTPLLRIWIFVFYPLAAIANLMNSGSIDVQTASVTEDELKSLVDAGQQDGVLEQEEREMIYSIFQLGDTLAREIMVPRIDITALDVQTPFDQAVDSLLQSGNSRVPVYENSIDHILGVLYAKDLLRVWRQHDQLTSLRDLLRPAYFIPEAKKVDELMAEMQSQRVHLALVVDEYGGLAGLVTLEDIVEEIVGEIQDEFDRAEDLPYQKIGQGEYQFQGRVGLDDFNEVMGSSLPSDEAETLGGFIFNRIGHVPAAGESVRVDNLMLTVTQVNGRRIRKVRAQWIAITQESQDGKTNVD
jgi:CBS domain containing-hemolysin-like protein